MKKFFINVLLFILLVPCIVSAKELVVNEFTYAEGRDEFLDEVIGTSDGGYVTVGYLADEDVDAYEVSDSSDALIIKYDKDDKIVWKKTFGGTLGDYYTGVTELSDGSLIVVGYTQSTDIEGITSVGSYDGIIVKYDKNGNLLWKKNYGGIDEEWLFHVEKTSDGGFVAVGHTFSTEINGVTSNGSKDALIVKFDKNANVEWQTLFGGSSYDHFKSVVQDSDGSYVAVGFSRSSGIADTLGEPIIAKFNSKGENLWSNSYSTNNVVTPADRTKAVWIANSDGYNDVLIDDEGNYIAVGDISSSLLEDGDFTSDMVVSRVVLSTPDTYGLISKYSKEGVKELDRIFKNCAGSFTSIEKVNSGGYLVSGFLEENSTVNQRIIISDYYDAIVIKFDKDLNGESEQFYAGNMNDKFLDLGVTKNNKYVAVGFSSSTNLEAFPNSDYNDGIVLTNYYKFEVTKENPEDDTFIAIQEDGKGKIDVTPEEGYELSSITIKDTAGNVVRYYEENGVYYFDLTDDVIVSVKYTEKVVVENPNTFDIVGIAMILFFFLSVGIAIKCRKKMDFINA